MVEKDDIKVSQMMETIRSNLNLPEKVYFFDTTLRDGEQTPGISFTLAEKKLIAKALDEAKIDIIEAGFPVISSGDYECCKMIAGMGLDCEVIGLARLLKKDIDSVVDASMDSIHVFIATSDLHLKNKLKMTRNEVLDRITEMVGYAKDHYKIVEFSAEDATRSDLDFLIKANMTAIEAGATRINIPDTVGTISPTAYGHIIKNNREAFPKDVRISVHCHNDFGLAVANSLAGVENGAAQIQTTVLGTGERAGNASFEESVMSIYAFYGIPMNINTKKLYPTAKLVESFCGSKFRIPTQAPLIGRNAFRHESGIHTHAMIQNARTYEPITPSLLGINRGDEINQILADSIQFGKHSGRHALKAKLENMGITFTDDQFSRIMNRIKAIGDKGHQIMEEDFMAIVRDEIGDLPKEEKYVILDELTVLTGSVTPTSTVKLKIKKNGDYETIIGSSIGVGPVDASMQAILKIIKQDLEFELLSYNIDAVTGGTDALGRVFIELMDKKTQKIVTASATNEDVVMSSVLALLNGMNKLIKATKENSK
ncbi:MAG: 2-isopropylmalate synthase [Candidatus Lokiarchaeota archaeon]|nr:2-isopropylmalate synthase [Candidatus Lokiarchaeota archaeon]